MNNETSKQLNELLGGYDFICPVCGADTFTCEIFCSRCAKQIYLNNGKTCKLCGTALYGVEDYCSKCGKADRYFDKAVSLYKFEGKLKEVFYKFKFGGLSSLCQRFSVDLAKLMRESFPFNFDYVTYVPMDETSQKARGYNQSLLICAALCDTIKVSPVALLIKAKNVLPQEALSYKKRVENVKGAYAVSEQYGKLLKDKVVLIIDDVLTTGATTSECARVLKKKGAKQVFVLTLASRAETILTE